MTGTGQILRYVHKKENCDGHNCPVHNPSAIAAGIGADRSEVVPIILVCGLVGERVPGGHVDRHPER